MRIAISLKLPPIAPVPKYLTWASLILSNIQLEVLTLAEPLQPDTNIGDLGTPDSTCAPQHKMTDEEPSLNIPSLLTLAVVSYFVLRWFFNRDESSAGGNRGRGRGNVVDPAQVEQIAQMFPQLSTRDIMWDLQRNGGSVAATTERVLTGRGLETVRVTLMLSLIFPAWVFSKTRRSACRLQTSTSN